MKGVNVGLPVWGVGAPAKVGGHGVVICGRAPTGQAPQDTTRTIPGQA